MAKVHQLNRVLFCVRMRTVQAASEALWISCVATLTTLTLHHLHPTRTLKEYGNWTKVPKLQNYWTHIKRFEGILLSMSIWGDIDERICSRILPILRNHFVDVLFSENFVLWISKNLHSLFWLSSRSSLRGAGRWNGWSSLVSFAGGFSFGVSRRLGGDKLQTWMKKIADDLTLVEARG